MGMEKLGKILDRKAKEIMEGLEEDMARAVDSAKRSFEAYIEELKEASKVTLPINVLDILSKGGEVLSAVFESKWTIQCIEVHVNGGRVLPRTGVLFRHPPGKYRITLIVEPIEVKKG